MQLIFVEGGWGKVGVGVSAFIGWFLVYLNILFCSKKYKKGYK